MTDKVYPDVTPTVHDPDGDLVARIAQGDQGAARELVDRHLTRLLSVARRLLGQQEDAEEVVQEVFLKVWTHAQTWDPGKAKFQTWMHRVTINLCYDRLRKHREVTMDSLPDQEDERPTPVIALHDKQVSERVQEAIQALPDRQRVALTLCHFQGMSNRDAAEVLEISVDALESLLARARRGLKAMLIEDASELVGGIKQ